MAPVAAPPLVLTIAGFDPTGGAGVLADIKAIAANQAYGLACVTAQTVQNTQGVRSFQAVSSTFLEEQLDYLLADVRPRAIKIGMLGSRAVVEAVARQLDKHPVAWTVLDPILTASSGPALSDSGSWEAMRQKLLPRASVLTPNVPEAEALTGMKIDKLADMQEAAAKLHSLGPKYVIVKGGHLERPVDLLYDGTTFSPLAADRIRTTHTHGTGCTFSAALAANLALGKQVPDAAVIAKAYVTAALRQAYGIGSGPGPLNHLYRLQESPTSRNVDPAPHSEFTTR